MGFVDGLYGRRNVSSKDHHHGHQHNNDHAAPAKDALDKVTASGAAASLDCDSECGPHS
jgi:hypothetical protein